MTHFVPVPPPTSPPLLSPDGTLWTPVVIKGADPAKGLLVTWRDKDGTDLAPGSFPDEWLPHNAAHIRRSPKAAAAAAAYPSVDATPKQLEGCGLDHALVNCETMEAQNGVPWGDGSLWTPVRIKAVHPAKGALVEWCMPDGSNAPPGTFPLEWLPLDPEHVRPRD